LRLRKLSLAASVKVRNATPNMIASLITRRPTPERKGKPWLASPSAAGTQAPGVVMRKEKRGERHENQQKTPKSRESGLNRIYGDENANRHNDHAKTIGYRIGSVGMVPLSIGSIKASAPSGLHVKGAQFKIPRNEAAPSRVEVPDLGIQDDDRCFVASARLWPFDIESIDLLRAEIAGEHS